MIPKLALLGLAAIVLFASNATAAEFHSEGEPTTLTGAQEAGTSDEFEVDLGVIKCKTITYHGTLPKKTTTSVAVNPTYEGCTGETGGGVKTTVHIEANECSFVFWLGTVTFSFIHGTFDIQCKEGEEIEAKVTDPFGKKEVICTIKIPAQSALKGVQYYNMGSGATREITVLIASGSIKYTQNKGVGLGACADSGLTENGLYVGTAQVKGETDPGGTQTGIWIE